MGFKVYALSWSGLPKPSGEYIVRSIKSYLDVCLFLPLYTKMLSPQFKVQGKAICLHEEPGERGNANPQC